MYKRIISALLILSFGMSIWPVSTARAVVSQSVVISELMWMGSSASAFDEWIELRNLTDQDIDLSQWRLTRKSSGTDTIMLTIPAGKTIPARGFFLISNYDSSAPQSTLNIQPDLVNSDVSLVNSALQIKLYDQNNVLVDAADDGIGAPLAGQYDSGTIWKSMERVVNPGDGTIRESWRTATSSVNFNTGAQEFGTPRVPNGNSEPIAQAGSDISATINEPVLFDGSESADPESDPLSYTWDFGDGSNGTGVTPTHQYETVGTYTVTLTVNDGELTASDSLAVVIAVAEEKPAIPDEPSEAPDSKPPASPQQPNRSNTNSGSGQTPITKSGKLRLTEVFPNPDGSDQAGEFIELYNADSKSIPLAGWTISDEKRTISLPETSTIGSKKYLSLPYSTTHLFLNNSGGTLKLIDPFGLTISNVAYPESASGQSFARTADLERWQWTNLPTPGEANKFSEAGNKETDNESEIDNSGNVDNGASGPTESTSVKPENTQPAEISAEELTDTPARTLVRLSGTVVVAPGMFSVSSFWIMSDGQGVEVVSSAKDFPKLTLSNQVEVIGRTTDVGIGLRINLQKDGATIQSQKSDLQPTEIEISDLTEEAIGQFVKIEGIISELKGTQFSVVDEAGDSVQVVLKRGTGIKTDKLSKDQHVTVIGLVGTGSSGIQIWPRIAEDIKAKTDDSTDDVLGATTEQQNNPANPLAVVSKKTSLAWPIIVASALCLGVGVWFYLRWRKKAKQESDGLSA